MAGEFPRIHRGEPPPRCRGCTLWEYPHNCAGGACECPWPSCVTAQRAQRTQRAQRLAGGEFPRIHRDELLRGHSWSAVLTGSQVYGTPSESSDVDLVILASPEVQLELSRLLGAELNPGSGPVRFGASSLRVGKLNLIMTCDPAELAAWRKGTAELATRKPVTREQAVAHLKACGVGLPDVEGEVEPEGEAHPWL